MKFWGKSIFNQKHQHNFQPVASDPMLATTQVLYRCECGELKTERILGVWTIEQIRGEKVDANSTSKV